MKMGDPKTARILFVVAIGAVGFVLIQVLPAAGAERRGAGPQPADAAAAGGSKTLSSEVPSDSFSSPLLTKTTARTDIESGAPVVRPVSPYGNGLLPGPMPDLTGRLAIDGVRSAPEAKPPPPQPPKRTICLSGVVCASAPVAFLSVDGKDSRDCRPGDLVGPGIRLLEVKESTVILSVAGKRRVLNLGQVTEL